MPDEGWEERRADPGRVGSATGKPPRFEATQPRWFLTIMPPSPLYELCIHPGTYPVLWVAFGPPTTHMGLRVEMGQPSRWFACDKLALSRVSGSGGVYSLIGSYP